MTLNANTFEEVERDTTAMGQAVGVIALSAVSLGIGNIYYGGITGIVTGVLASLVGFVIWSALVWVVGTKVMPDPQTSADFPETFRVIAFAAAPGVLGIATIIPLLGWLILFALYLWMMAAMVVAVKSVLDYTNIGKAIVVVLMGFIVYCICWAMFMAAMLGTAMMRRAF